MFSENVNETACRALFLQWFETFLTSLLWNHKHVNAGTVGKLWVIMFSSWLEQFAGKCTMKLMDWLQFSLNLTSHQCIKSSSTFKGACMWYNLKMTPRRGNFELYSYATLFGTLTVLLQSSLSILHIRSGMFWVLFFRFSSIVSRLMWRLS